ncbi:MAG TPA: hypothetical protein VFJ13_03595 [Paracoccaceae bacterium]|nr:hypothetical protein [Paracoccaceae bacterium]
MKALTAPRFSAAEFERTVYVATPEHGTPYTDVLKREYWAHVGAMLKPFDRIEVRAEDGTWFAELIVRNAGPLFADVAELRKVDLDVAEPPAADSAFEIKWRGPVLKFGVVRKADGGALKDGFATRDEAARWLLGHTRAIAA